MSSNQNPIRPRLRSDKVYDIRDHMKACIEAYAEELVQTCITCTEFNEQSEFCRKYNARPPARVIAYGCPSYFNEEEIPF